MDTEMLNAIEAAKMLGVTTATLTAWRKKNIHGLRWIKIGRMVRYRKSDLSAFIEARARD